MIIRVLPVIGNQQVLCSKILCTDVAMKTAFRNLNSVRARSLQRALLEVAEAEYVASCYTQRKNGWAVAPFWKGFVNQLLPDIKMFERTLLN